MEPTTAIEKEICDAVNLQKPIITVNGIDITPAVSFQFNFNKVMKELDLVRLRIYSETVVYTSDGSNYLVESPTNEELFIKSYDLDIRNPITFKLMINMHKQLIDFCPDPFIPIRTTLNTIKLANYVARILILPSPHSYRESRVVLINAFRNNISIFRTAKAFSLFDAKNELTYEGSIIDGLDFQNSSFVKFKITRPRLSDADEYHSDSWFRNEIKLPGLHPIFVILADLT